MPLDDEDCGYVLDCDGSLVGAGAVLQQWQNGKLRVIEYASRTFSKQERNWCVTRREMASLIFGLQMFKKYLLGRHFTVRVDHMALKYYSTTPEPVGQQARYLDFIAQFDFDIQHRSGASHGNCDSLSRLRPCERDTGEPCKQCNRRITGRHKLYAVQTRRQRQRQQQDGGGTVGHASGAGPTSDTGCDVTAGPPRVAPHTGVQGPAPASSSTPVETRDNSRWPAAAAAAAAKRGTLLQRTAPAAAAAGVANWTAEFIA